MTDCNVMLGKLQPEFFRPSSARTRTSRWTPTRCARFTEMAAEVESSTGISRSLEELADGFLPLLSEHGQCNREDLGAARL